MSQKLKGIFVAVARKHSHTECGPGGSRTSAETNRATEEQVASDHIRRIGPMTIVISNQLFSLDFSVQEHNATKAGDVLILPFERSRL